VRNGIEKGCERRRGRGGRVEVGRGGTVKRSLSISFDILSNPRVAIREEKMEM
jgi:hypothetical protein